MNIWQATFLGLKQLPRELSGFEIEAFFTFTASERALIEARRGASLKLGLALQIGFLRMSGRVGTRNKPGGAFHIARSNEPGFSRNPGNHSRKKLASWPSRTAQRT